MSRRTGTYIMKRKREHICACCVDFSELTPGDRLGICRHGDSEHCDHVLYRQHSACGVHFHKPEFKAGKTLNTMVED